MSIATSQATIRPLRPADRARVEDVTCAVGLFWDYEIPIALEVFDDATGAGPSGIVDPDYESACAEVDGVLAGWAVWGPRPRSPGTFDLYWIVVDPRLHGTGVGRRLLDEMGERIAGRAAEVVVETSGRPDYEATRRFYERNGYRQVGRIPDYYAPGDDQVTYQKVLGPRLSALGPNVGEWPIAAGCPDRQLPSAECRVPSTEGRGPNN